MSLHRTLWPSVTHNQHQRCKRCKLPRTVLRRLPSKILSGPSHEGDIKPCDMTPMSIVVIQEAARYERLVQVVRASSRAVIGGSAGWGVMFEEFIRKFMWKTRIFPVILFAWKIFGYMGLQNPRMGYLYLVRTYLSDNISGKNKIKL